MAVTVSQMFIPVHDPEAALGFYRDALGLEVRLDVSSDGFRWVTVAAPGQDVDIVLSQPHGGRSQAEGDALLTLVTQGSLQAAIFRSDDLGAYVGRYNGIYPIKDSSGHTVRLVVMTAGYVYAFNVAWDQVWGPP